jgi:hypothetical protein
LVVVVVVDGVVVPPKLLSVVAGVSVGDAVVTGVGVVSTTTYGVLVGVGVGVESPETTLYPTNAKILTTKSAPTIPTGTSQTNLFAGAAATAGSAAWKTGASFLTCGLMTVESTAYACAGGKTSAK